MHDECTIPTPTPALVPAMSMRPCCGAVGTSPAAAGWREVKTRRSYRHPSTSARHVHDPRPDPRRPCATRAADAVRIPAAGVRATLGGDAGGGRREAGDEGDAGGGSVGRANVAPGTSGEGARGRLLRKPRWAYLMLDARRCGCGVRSAGERIAIERRACAAPSSWIATTTQDGGSGVCKADDAQTSRAVPRQEATVCTREGGKAFALALVRSRGWKMTSQACQKRTNVRVCAAADAARACAFDFGGEVSALALARRARSGRHSRPTGSPVRKGRSDGVALLASNVVFVPDSLFPARALLCEHISCGESPAAGDFTRALRVWCGVAEAGAQPQSLPPRQCHATRWSVRVSCASRMCLHPRADARNTGANDRMKGRRKGAGAGAWRRFRRRSHPRFRRGCAPCSLGVPRLLAVRGTTTPYKSLTP
ncbi:hypothetical protein B0H11DRAFT_1937298 [Mycena galericulata]|nr:hypothetical protein B0H11DRAFT_1937298 [Mycena galericulata]